MQTLTQEHIDTLHDFYNDLYEGGIIDKNSYDMFIKELEDDANGKKD